MALARGYAMARHRLTLVPGYLILFLHFVRILSMHKHLSITHKPYIPVSILYKSIAGRNRSSATLTGG